MELNFRHEIGTVSVQFHPIVKICGSENDKFSVIHPKLEFPRSKFLRFNLCSTDSTRKGCIGRVSAVPEDEDFFWEKALTTLLDMAETPTHMKNLSIKELKQLADEIRSELSFITSKMPRYFKAILATVELTVVLHHVFDSLTDKILWDVVQQETEVTFISNRHASVEVNSMKHPTLDNLARIHLLHL
ncbi:1-deoxy-D-xylulose-5-phosphate synthase, chloroplastic-like isoform X2 [Papaver somniferum]|uniref:1-deoxy-D-xylulose-5-phosphate synthase, chloroplastic-like isoform X2 n=1 Tax=Papaver somniferum TaxID=3469 RepID=UPI000E701E96|nr:1-deoxy-D-xylulose-5-phosphate synthase, chloroplastic-like isoform X2 [Papaver somniferum]